MVFLSTILYPVTRDGDCYKWSSSSSESITAYFPCAFTYLDNPLLLFKNVHLFEVQLVSMSFAYT